MRSGIRNHNYQLDLAILQHLINRGIPPHFREIIYTARTGFSGRSVRRVFLALDYTVDVVFIGEEEKSRDVEDSGGIAVSYQCYVDAFCRHIVCVSGTVEGKWGCWDCCCVKVESGVAS